MAKRPAQPDLCSFHRWTLSRWRSIHQHESRSDFHRRCRDVAKACPTCPPIPAKENR